MQVQPTQVQPTQAQPTAYVDDGAAHDAGLALFASAAPQLADVFVSLASDVALLLDAGGTIVRVAQSSAAPLGSAVDGWVGRRWVDTVTGDTRRKVEHLLGDAAGGVVARRREVNHCSDGGDGIPVACSVVQLGPQGPLLAVGRDLRSVAAIQQRFVEGQQELERGYWRTRHAESRYQVLFQMATDAVLTVDALSLQVIEANRRADVLLARDGSGAALAGTPVLALFGAHSHGAVSALLNAARSSATPMEIHARLARDNAVVGVAATPFRADDTLRLLLRVRSVQPADSADSGARRDAALARLVDAHAEGIVVVDSGGRVQLANPAFVRWVQARSEAQLGGQPLTRWLDAALWQALATRVRRHGVAEHAAVRLHDADAAPPALALSAVLLTEGEQECIGLSLRPLPAPSPTTASGSAGPQHPLAQQIDALATALGSTDLAALLQRTQALAERHFVAAALQRSDDNTDRAAALLGIAAERVTALRAQAAQPGLDAPACG